MADSAEPLAWRSGEGTEDLYTAADLKDSEKVKDIFSACKVGQGYITANGWAFLFSVWKMEDLLAIDREGGWFHSGKPEEAAAHLVYQSLMAGFHPLSGEKGDYEADSGLFLSLGGRKYKIDWDEIITKES